MLDDRRQQLAANTLTLKVLADGQLLYMQLVIDRDGPQEPGKLPFRGSCDPNPGLLDGL
ncbi:hypothetical protein D3C78_1911150 [compost metagenome]